MKYFSRVSLLEAQVIMMSFLTAFILECNLTYQACAINEMGWTRKLVNNLTESPPLQGTNVQVNVHYNFNLTLAITLPIGAVIFTVLGWTIYNIRNKKPTQQAEEAEVVADNRPTQEAEDTIAVTVNVTAQ